MAGFAVTGRISQSQDGKTLTYNDTSNYVNNDEVLDTGDFASRVVGVYDALDVLLGTITLAGAELTGTITISKDGWYRFMPTWTTDADPAVVYTGHINYQSKQFFALLQLLYTNLITCACGCSSKAERYANQALQCVYAAITDFNYGDALGCQAKMDTANLLMAASLK